MKCLKVSTMVSGPFEGGVGGFDDLQLLASLTSLYSVRGTMYSADDLIGAVEMSPSEASYAYSRLTLVETEFDFSQSVDDFARIYGFMPMMVARHVAEYRQNDSSLNALISTNEFLIKNFGKKRLSHEFVEGTLRKSDKFWRNNDPLGVYQPGDMFYVDDNHPWRDYFPLLILVPTVCAFLLFGVAMLIRLVVR